MKWYGEIGFFEHKESENNPGVWITEITKRTYYGDVIRDTRKFQYSEKVNADINISNRISIIADPYATENFHSILYITYMGAKWKVTDIEVQYPRLYLSIGGLYNESQSEQIETPSNSGRSYW